MLFVNGTSLYRKSCANCIKARAACDHNRPCSRCITMKCVDKCVDVERKRRTKKPKIIDDIQPTNIQTQPIIQTQNIQPQNIQPHFIQQQSHPIVPQTISPQPPTINPQTTLPALFPSTILPPARPSSSSSSSLPSPSSSSSLSSLASSSFPSSSTRMNSPSINFSSVVGTPDIINSSPLPPPYDINLPSIANFDNIPDALLDFSAGSPKLTRPVEENNEESNENNENNKNNESNNSPPTSNTTTSTNNTPTPPQPSSPISNNNSVVEAPEYTFTCHRLPDYVSDLLSTYLALQKLSLAHRSTSPISISFDAKCEPFDPQPVIMLNKNTLGIVDCNLPFANFIGYDTVSDFLEEKSNFTDLITPNGVAMSKRVYEHFLHTSIHKFERLELLNTRTQGTRAVTLVSHITERHTIITLTESFLDMPMCFLAPFIKRCLPNIQLSPCRRTHCQCVCADILY